MLYRVLSSSALGWGWAVSVFPKVGLSTLPAEDGSQGDPCHSMVKQALSRAIKTGPGTTTMGGG